MKFTRKKFIVTPSIQYKIIFLMAISILIPSLLLGYSILHNLKVLSNVSSYSPDAIQSVVDLAISKTTVALVLGIPVIVMLIISWGIVISNRIVGPIYRLEKELDEIIKTRQFKEIHFRKNDAFQSLAVKINTLLSGIMITGDKSEGASSQYNLE